MPPCCIAFSFSISLIEITFGYCCWFKFSVKSTTIMILSSKVHALLKLSPWLASTTSSSKLGLVADARTGRTPPVARIRLSANWDARWRTLWINTCSIGYTQIKRFRLTSQFSKFYFQSCLGKSKILKLPIRLKKMTPIIGPENLGNGKDNENGNLAKFSNCLLGRK